MIVVYVGDAGAAVCLSAEVRDSITMSHDEMGYYFPYDLLNVEAEEEDKPWLEYIGDIDTPEQSVSHSIVLEILPGRDCPLEPG